ncbi:MAG: DUF3021 family protein [Thermoclostridium sp.]|nr:DUF3021 family protein [Thermoclostridium sp.]
MKELMKKSMTLTAMIILTIYTVSSIRFGDWADTLFFWELLLMSIVVFLVLFVLHFLQTSYYLLDLLLEYVTVSIVVAVTGLLLGWFQLPFLWHVLVYVTPIYVVGCLLDLNKTRRDVDFINQKIQERREGIKKDEA